MPLMRLLQMKWFTGNGGGGMEIYLLTSVPFYSNTKSKNTRHEAKQIIEIKWIDLHAIALS